MTNTPPFALYSTTRGVSVVRTGPAARGRVELNYLLRISTGEVSALGGGIRIERPFLSQAAPRLTPLPPSVMTRLLAGYTAVIPDAWIRDPTSARDPEPEEDSETEDEESLYDETETEDEWEDYDPPEYDDDLANRAPRYEDVPPPSYNQAILTPPAYEPSPRHMRAQLAAEAAARRMVAAC